MSILQNEAAVQFLGALASEQFIQSWSFGMWRIVPKTLRALGFRPESCLHSVTWGDPAALPGPSSFPIYTTWA